MWPFHTLRFISGKVGNSKQFSAKCRFPFSIIWSVTHTHTYTHTHTHTHTHIHTCRQAYTNAPPHPDAFLSPRVRINVSMHRSIHTTHFLHWRSHRLTRRDVTGSLLLFDCVLIFSNIFINALLGRQSEILSAICFQNSSYFYTSSF